jgi:hypothetical protein
MKQTLEEVAGILLAAKEKRRKALDVSGNIHRRDIFIA